MEKLTAIFIDKKDGSLNGLFYALLYLVLAHVFFWKLLVPGQVIFGTDIENQSYPLQFAAVREMMKDRSIMLWNPYIFSGMPFLASFSFPFFYPFALMFFALPLGFAMGYELLLHFFMMGLFMYFFLRHLRLSRPAAFLGGLLYMFNAHLTSLVYPGHGGKLFTMTYAPLALLFLDKMFEERTFYYASLVGLMVGLMFFSGHIQILFYCGIVMLLFFLTRLALDLSRNNAKWALKKCAAFVFAFAVGALLYAVMLLPAMEYRGFTHRAGGMTAASSYQFATSFSQPPEDMLYLALRNPFGWGKDYGPTVPTTDGIFYRGRLGLKLSVDYFSVIGIVLMLVGAVFVRNRHTWFFLGMSLLTMFLSMGGYNPLYVYVYKYVPGFSIFRIPYAIMILIPLCWTVVAAYGMQYLMDGRGREGRGFLYFITAGAALSVAVLAVSAYWGRNIFGTAEWFTHFRWVQEMLWGYYGDIAQRFAFFLGNLYVFVIFLAASVLLLFAYRKGYVTAKYLAPALAVFFLVEMWPIGWDFVKPVPESALEYTFIRETPPIKLMKQDKEGPFRAFSLVTNNELLYHGIQSTTGYHAVPLAYYEKTLDRVDFMNPVIDLLDAKYLMLPKKPEFNFVNYPEAGAREYLTGKYELIDGSDMFFYKNRHPLKRAWLVGSLIHVDDVEQALDVISDQRFKPYEMAVVAEDPETPVPPADLTGQKVEVADYRPDKIKFKVSAPADAYMVASEVWYPGWKAYVDGVETKLYRADYLLRGLVVPKGEHEVVMEFEPVLYKIGGAISLVTLVSLVGLIVWMERGRRLKGGRTRQ